MILSVSLRNSPSPSVAGGRFLPPYCIKIYASITDDSFRGERRSHIKTIHHRLRSGALTPGTAAAAVVLGRGGGGCGGIARVIIGLSKISVYRGLWFAEIQLELDRKLKLNSDATEFEMELDKAKTRTNLIELFSHDVAAQSWLQQLTVLMLNAIVLSFQPKL